MLRIIKAIIKEIGRPAGPTVEEISMETEEIQTVGEGHVKEEITITGIDQILSRMVIRRFTNNLIMENIIIIEEPDQTVNLNIGMKLSSKKTEHGQKAMEGQEVVQDSCCQMREYLEECLQMERIFMTEVTTEAEVNPETEIEI